jgi:hypothetical protein
MATPKARFDTAIEFLVQQGYLERDGAMLSSTKKGTSVAKHFVDPIFMETCIQKLNIEHTITSTESMITYISDLLQSRSSPKPWTQGMQKNMLDNFNFRWLYKQGTRYWDFSLNSPKIQWADSILFTFEAVKSVAEELSLKNIVSKLTIINYSFKHGVIPYQLVKIGLRLKELGLYDLGSKYLLYLNCNGVLIDEKDELNGPTEFKSPGSALFNLNVDQYEAINWSKYPIRYSKPAASLGKYYGKRVVMSSEESDKTLILNDQEPEWPWDV